jgi:hypothetical protein
VWGAQFRAKSQLIPAGGLNNGADANSIACCALPLIPLNFSTVSLLFSGYWKRSRAT